LLSDVIAKSVLKMVWPSTRNVITKLRSLSVSVFVIRLLV
jgi:hypothetical protein